LKLITFMMKIARLTKDLGARIRRGDWSQESSIPSRSVLSEEYGVSPASVSIAIRNLAREGIVRVMPRKGVFVVEGEMDVTRKNTDTIGLRGGYLPPQQELLQMDVPTLFGKDIFNGIWEAAHAEHCPILLLPGDPEDKRLTKKACESAGIRGLIFLGGGSYDEALELRRVGFPVILANQPVGGSPLNYVDYDARGALAKIVAQFVGLGHRRIGVLCPGFTSVPGYYAKLKLDFVQIMEDIGIFLNPHSYWRSVSRSPKGFSEEAIQAVVDEWSQLPEPPTAIFCWTPDISAILQTILQLRGLNVPRDISLACSGYLSESEVKVSGFIMPHRECGKTLLSELHATILNPFNCAQKLLPCTFTDKGTIIPRDA
jgi:DNA-binding LacI/PurR family transcriptional regulator